MKKHILSISVVAAVTLAAVAIGQQSSQSSQSSQSKSEQGSARASSSASASSSSSGGVSANGGQSAWGFGSGSASGPAIPTHAIFYQLVEDKQEGRERVMKAHHDYLVSLAKDGKVVLAGPWRDEPGGMSLIRVRTDEQAEEILANDPAAKAGYITGEVKAWKVAISAPTSAVINR